MSKVKTTQNLKYKFTREEKESHAAQLAKEIQSLEATEKDKKEANAGFAARITAIKANIGRLSEWINSGFEFRPTDVEITMDKPKAGMKTTVRLDTKEKVSVDRMTEAEKQAEMFDRDLRKGKKGKAKEESQPGATEIPPAQPPKP